MNIEKTDVVIIGAGPVGLFAVFECGMVRLKCHVIDALDHAGGQCIALYPEKPIFDIPGYPQILAADLVEKLKEQAAPFNPVYHLGQRVDKVTEQADKSWLVETSAGKKIQSKAIIIAAGCGAFGPNRPPLDGIEQYENKSVFYYVKSREEFRGKRIVIAGGGDSALDWAINLHNIAKVMVVHRRDKFRGAPESVARLKQLTDSGKVELVVPYQLSGLEGKGGQISSVIG
jgi:thioredoxin reductase (NADPH)